MEPFLLHRTCPNTLDCTCNDLQNDVICESRGLSQVPTFLGSTDSFQSITLHNNSIRYIDVSAFSAFSCDHQEFRLDLSRNKILAIDNNAFLGIEKCRLHIDLAFNELSNLPHAFSILRELKTLVLFGNPIVDIDMSIMAGLSSSLTDFRVDVRHFGNWPGTVLQALPEVERLDVIGIPSEHLDSTAFQQMPKLKEVTISESKLRGIPDALCSLSSMKTLNISNNEHFNESGYKMFEVCGSQNRSSFHIDNLYFYNNKISVFPNFMSMFPSVRKLGVRNNLIASMNEDELSFSPDLRAISLDRNYFTRIPFALNKFPALTYVSLADNKISSLEEYDLGKLTHLATLDLDQNPLQYITQNAFASNQHLSTLYLSGTSLQRIPLAITLLPELTMLTLNEADIICECDMDYVSQWTHSANVYFRNSMCKNGEFRIDDFVANYNNRC